MDKRIRLGLLYLWDNRWLGGVYYIQNLIKAFNALEDRKKPIIDIHCLNEESFEEIRDNTNYPYLERRIVKILYWKKILQRIVGIFSRTKRYYVSLYSLNSDDDVYFPYCYGSYHTKCISWCPDFQEKHLPQYFTKTIIKGRDEEIRSTCLRKIPIVFSSYNSLNDFHKYYPDFNSHTCYVVPFAVSLPDFSDVSIDDLKVKYGITKRYLFCPNQFWQHKNHFFLFKAIKKVLDHGIDIQLVCTGRMYDYRAPEYIKEITNFIESDNLCRNILILGLIEKRELLCLMKHSYAVVQPSLFEGWNTTVEECKAMSKFVFLSDLPVHREQTDKNVCFFDPTDENDLVNKLITVLPNEEHIDYKKNISLFGESMYDAISARIR